MPISEKYNLIYVHIPKTGGTSIREIFGLNAPDRDKLIGNYKGKSLTHLTLREIKEKIPFEEFSKYFSFSVIRDPRERLISSYFYYKKDPSVSIYETKIPLHKRILTDSKKYFYPIFWRNRFIRNQIKNSDFPSFIKNIVIPNKNKFVHFLPQSEFLVDESGKIGVDEIIRFENFEKNTKNLLNKLGIDRGIPHLNKSNRDRKIKYIDEELNELIVDEYESDFKMFNYPKDLF